MDNTIILKGRNGYLRDLRPFCDSVYEKSGGKLKKVYAKNHPFVVYVKQTFKYTNRKPVVDVVRQYVRKRKIKSKREALHDLKPFLDFEAGGVQIFNCQRLSEQLPFVVAYKHLTNSIIYLEAVMQ